MVIDTTISSFQKFLNSMVYFAEIQTRRKHYKFPSGKHDNLREHSEFRQLYIREFLEKNGQDSDIDLESTVVFWSNGEIVAVTGAIIGNQSVLELLT